MKKEISFSLGKLNIRIDIFFIVILAIMMVAGYIAEFTIIFTSIFLHEAGHILAAAFYGMRVYTLRILPVGLNAVMESDIYCRRKRIITYFSGPMVNILIAAVSATVGRYYIQHDDRVYFVFIINICLAAFNLLPVLPLDGGKILKDLLAERMGIYLASRFVKRFSRFFSVIIIAAGIIQVIGEIRNFSLILIGVYIYYTTRFEEMEAALVNIKSVVYRRARLIKKGVYPARDLVVIKNMHLSEVIKYMDFDRFHIVNVLDDDLKLLKVFTENEILEALLKYDTELTFEEFIDKML